MINVDDPSDGKETEGPSIQSVSYTDQCSSFRVISQVWVRPNAKQLAEIQTNTFKGVSVLTSEGRLVLAEKIETIVYQSGHPHNVSYEYRAVLSNELPICD